jgi:hypothetical protein
MKNPVRGKMVQRDREIMKETVKKGESQQAKIRANKEKENDDITRINIRYPVLAGYTPTREILRLDQTLSLQLLDLILSGAWGGPDLLRYPRRHELWIVDGAQSGLLISLGSLALASHHSRVLALAYALTTRQVGEWQTTAMATAAAAVLCGS